MQLAPGRSQHPRARNATCALTWIFLSPGLGTSPGVQSRRTIPARNPGRVMCRVHVLHVFFCMLGSAPGNTRGEALCAPSSPGSGVASWSIPVAHQIGVSACLRTPRIIPILRARSLYSVRRLAESPTGRSAVGFVTKVPALFPTMDRCGTCKFAPPSFDSWNWNCRRSAAEKSNTLSACNAALSCSGRPDSAPPLPWMVTPQLQVPFLRIASLSQLRLAMMAPCPHWPRPGAFVISAPFLQTGGVVPRL